MSDLAETLQRDLDLVVASTDRLLETVDGMADDDLRAPSLLPGWTRAHVLTHVARNADGLARLAEAARTGEPGEMYPGGREGRDAEIEAGAGRRLGDVRLDLADSAERLLQAFTDFPPEALPREVAMTAGSAYAWELPALRLRELEIHHVDLGLRYQPAHWSGAFAVRTLDQLAEFFRTERECPVAVLRDAESGRTWQVGPAGPTLYGPAWALTAWLVGRAVEDAAAELVLEPAGPLPSAPVWR